MSDSLGSVVNDATVLEAVAQHGDLIARERSRNEATFAMSSAVVEALGPAKVFRVMGPDVEVSLGGMVRMLERIAFADPSVAWVAANSMGVSALCRTVSGTLAAEVLQDHNYLYGAGLPPSGRVELKSGSAIVSGCWPVVSGCDHASYFGLNCVVHDFTGPRMNGSTPEIRPVLVPRSAVRIERTWKGVMAVKGSGSHAVVVENYALDKGALGGVQDSEITPSYWDHLPMFARQSLALAAIGVGITRASLEAAIKQAGSRVSAANGIGWVDYPSVQNSVATADIAVEASMNYLFSLADLYWEELALGYPSDRTRARLHAIADHVLRSGRQVVSDLLAAGSVDAIHSGHVLEQCLRDMHGFSIQWERYRALHYEAGRVILGAKPAHPLF